MKIRNYTFEEFVERVKEFHGYEAPGVIIGGFIMPRDLCLPSFCMRRYGETRIREIGPSIMHMLHMATP